ncbi:hypothetical protein QR90_04775 [Deinococcus radiopugnans]|uniref:Uncharacterized protein n=1 Tax=Deinococcus radiopugnans TaxID=57497 RepID=A0A0A7KEF1_9DEIO|nr:hypothetical protein QR90_04775 [Deinococcus radiopugnans]
MAVLLGDKRAGRDSAPGRVLSGWSAGGMVEAFGLSELIRVYAAPSQVDQGRAKHERRMKACHLARVGA